MVYLHRLNPFGRISGSLGGWAGDQFFYLARRASQRMAESIFEDRPPRTNHSIARAASCDQAHSCGALSAGLRIAIPLACAYAGISPARFSALSLISAVVSPIGYVGHLGKFLSLSRRLEIATQAQRSARHAGSAFPNAHHWRRLLAQPVSRY